MTTQLPAWSDEATTIAEMLTALRAFVRDRDWKQFHDVKNLSMAVASEAAELMAHFRWTPSESADDVLRDERSCSQVREEVADVMMLLLEFADLAKIDVAAAVRDKLEANEKKYPIDKAKGSAAKYDRL